MAVISFDQTKLSLQQNSTIEPLTILATVLPPAHVLTGSSARLALARYPVKSAA